MGNERLTAALAVVAAIGGITARRAGAVLVHPTAALVGRLTLAATLLRDTGHEVSWLDGIAEGWTWEQYCREVEAARPQLMMIESCHQMRPSPRSAMRK